MQLLYIFRVFIEHDSEYSLKLVIRSLGPTDTGVYTCDGFLEDITYEKQVTVEIYGKHLIVISFNFLSLQ